MINLMHRAVLARKWTGTAPPELPTADLIGSYDGTMSTDGTYLLDQTDGVGETAMLPTAIVGDGLGLFNIDEITLPGDFRIDFSMSMTDASDTLGLLSGSSDTCQLYTYGNDSDLKIHIASTSSPNLIGEPWVSGKLNEITLTRVGTTLSTTLDGVSCDDQTVNGSDFITDRILATSAGTYQFMGKFNYLKFYNSSSTLIHHFVPGAPGSNTIWDVIIGKGYEGASFTDSNLSIQSKTDGTGSNYMNEEGYTIANGSSHYIDDGQVTLVTAGEAIPATCGFDGAGDPISTVIPGPLANDMTVRNMSCLQGDTTGHIAITGLLTTDTISVITGSDTPTCTIDGQLDIANNEQVFGLTITRSAAIWAYYPCQDEDPGDTTGTLVHDVVGGNDGTLTSFTGTAWGSRDIGENYRANGFSKSGDSYILADPDNAGHDQAGDPLVYLAGDWDTLQNMGVDVLGPLCADAQAMTEFTDGAEYDYPGQGFNVSDQIFNGDTGGVVYSADKDAGEITEIIAAIGDQT